MRWIVLFVAFIAIQLPALAQEKPSCALTLTVEHMNSSKGVLGLIIFTSPIGWPEDVSKSFRHTSFPAQAGTQTVEVPDLPPGRYALAVIHDVNENMRLDKNWLGKPKEQWGMSNNPHATFSAPPFEKAVFDLKADTHLRITLQ